MGGRESTGREGKKRISLGKVGTAPSSTCCGDQVKGYFKVVAPQWDRMRHLDIRGRCQDQRLRGERNQGVRATPVRGIHHSRVHRQYWR